MQFPGMPWASPLERPEVLDVTAQGAAFCRWPRRLAFGNYSHHGLSR